MLPWATTQSTITPPLVAFFTSTSAVSTTGLGLVQTSSYWTTFGQAVICALMVIGGIGFITIALFILVLAGTRITLPQRMLAREDLGVDALGGLLSVLRDVVLVDLAITVGGIALLIWPFHRYYRWPSAIWQAVFHSVSAFNTAGFDIVGPSSWTPFRTDYWLLSVATVEEILGAIGFTVILELIVVRKIRPLSLDTKLVVLFTLGLYAVATAVMLGAELTRGTSLDHFSWTGKIYTAFFNAVSASSTTGFSTIDFGHLTNMSLLITIAVMFIGGGAGSTAGGIKVNTFAVIVLNVWSSIRGQRRTRVFWREIAFDQALTAYTIAIVSLVLVAAAVLIVAVTSPAVPLQNAIFEVVSAFGTVGLSSGALPHFSIQGQIAMIFLMFVGRVTALSAVAAFSSGRRAGAAYSFPHETISIA